MTKTKCAKIFASVAIYIVSYSVVDVCAYEPGKFYSAINVGYAFNSIPTVHTFQTRLVEGTQPVAGSEPSYDNVSSSAKGLHGFGLTGSVGYNIDDSLRADIMLEYLNQNNKGPKVKDFYYTKERYFTKNSLSLAVNLYYDLNTATDFTPFITAGIGGELSKYKNKFSDTHAEIDTQQGVQHNFFYFPVDQQKNVIFDINNPKRITEIRERSKVHMLYQCGLGIAYKLMDDVLIDLTYRLVNSPKSELKTHFAGMSYDYVIPQQKTEQAQNTQQNDQKSQKTTLMTTNLKSQRIDEQKLNKSYKNSVLLGIRVQF